MTRGHKTNTLPETAELSVDGTRVCCMLCIEQSLMDSLARDPWMLLKSFNSHQKSAIHKRSVARLHEAERQAAALCAAQEEETRTFTVLGQLCVADSHIPEKPAVISSAEKMMWEDFDMGDITFDAGKDHSEILCQQRRDFELKASEYGVWDAADEPPEFVDHLDADKQCDEAEQDDLLADIMEAMAEQAEICEDTGDIRSPDAAQWSPYPSKLLFLLDALDNLPRLRISGSLMKMFLWLLREVGVKRVPSFDGLRKVQKGLRKESGIPTIHWMLPKGNAFSFNDPCALVANDWANPLVCSQLKVYPVIPRDGVISEIWHAQKWRHNLDRHSLSPMYDDGSCHYYIDEPAHLRSGGLVIPLQWLENEADGKIWVDVWEIEVEGGMATINDGKTMTIKAEDLQGNMLDLQDTQSIPMWSPVTIAAGHPSRMPNPDRTLAEGDPLYVNLINVFGDDVSGNRTKAWNKHWNIYITNRNLPRKLLQQEFHTHFVLTSTHASIPEQFQGIKEVIRETHKKLVKVRHATTGQQIRFKINCNCGPGDNPAQSEASGHIGAKGNHFCRKCQVGGSQKSKETNEGFHKMFYAGDARSSEQTLALVESQVKTACLGVAQHVKDSQQDTGVKDGYTQYWIDVLIDRARALQKEQPQHTAIDIQNELFTWVNANKVAVYNSFLTLEGFDASCDTPVEILHTILLGIVKYIWHGTHTSWSVAQKKTYSACLQGTFTSGLSIHAICAKYIMQYANSLIGRQFKTLVQVNAFHVYDLVDSLQFALTKAVGELTALLWFPEIRNLEEYLNDVETAVANVLDIAALIDPSKIIAKIKYHLLPHIREDILRFGPLVGVATEIFECFNTIFRYCSILSNHLAPSRDIAYQLAEQEFVKHCLSGGWWAAANSNWKEPGPALRNFASKNPVLWTMYGWMQAELLVLGTVKLMPLKQGLDKKLETRIGLRWRETQAGKAVNAAMHDSAAQLYRCTYVVAKSQDQCKVGSWIFAKSPLPEWSADADFVTGRIVEILQDSVKAEAFVIIDIFYIAATRDEIFGMPMLLRRFGESGMLMVTSQDILFEYNAQHDCRQAQCTASGQRPLVQERVDSNLIEDFIEHKPLDRFIVNTHALHNAHLIQAILPRELTAPIPYAADRQAHHYSIAEDFRRSQETK
ncbi:uncharacterized protein LACBIDRAFT_307447 [Laccaria bicolor S238N-H82]|uniref:Predicted protein n=1 Tax=Laccaria bicolor (strain S238N-H82 / ATCC MYA-4686) TaxID=486041 RepID=B0DQ60_LACBS|nr:uncharacterized protein LACBIDRAFT_307447 [Laccaria bicolor S238N-H82]EDR03329.1 predicted protein [Laccaria bicolor S238N-H82]|eukprot:XP_001886125.1 predicted protein [Laccaria bicolor S238N-H82]